MMMSKIHFEVHSKKKQSALLLDPVIESYNNQMDQLLRKYCRVEIVEGSGRAVKKWECKEAHAKYIFLKTELEEYITIKHPGSRN